MNEKENPQRRFDTAAGLIYQTESPVEYRRRLLPLMLFAVRFDPQAQRLQPDKTGGILLIVDVFGFE